MRCALAPATNKGPDMIYESCTGAGKPAVEAGLKATPSYIRWRAGVCPDCHAVASVDANDRIEPHTVRVIG